MQYNITFFNPSVEEDVLKLPETLLARFFSLADRMAGVGANLGAPHTKAMGDGLFELRLKGVEGIARVFYCTMVGKKIVMLHSFVKKTDKTPPKELKIAHLRLKECKHENI